MEDGLRLVAQDLSKGRLKRAAEAVARELDAGLSLPEAVAKHGNAFPPLYARLIEAGIAVGNLPAVLFNVGRHLELSQTLRTTITRSVAYPITLLTGIFVVSAFLSAFVLPELMGIFEHKNPVVREMLQPRGTINRAPWITGAVLQFGRLAPYIAGAMLVGLVLAFGVWPWVRSTKPAIAFRDAVLLRLPLIGRPLRFDLIGRWCDAVKIGVDAGLPLSGALSLGSEVIGSRRLQRDTALLINAHDVGTPLTEPTALSLLPVAVPASIEAALATNNLSPTLEALSSMYARQAAARASAIPAILTPFLLLLLAVLVGAMLAALFLPIVRLIAGVQGFSGSAF